MALAIILFNRVQYWTAPHSQSAYRCKRKPELGEGVGPIQPGVCGQKLKPGREPMSWAIIAILVALWALGLINSVGGSFIHALLAIAAIALLYKLLGGRRIMS